MIFHAHLWVHLPHVEYLRPTLRVTFRRNPWRCRLCANHGLGRRRWCWAGRGGGMQRRGRRRVRRWRLASGIVCSCALGSRMGWSCGWCILPGCRVPERRCRWQRGDGGCSLAGGPPACCPRQQVMVDELVRQRRSHQKEQPAACLPLADHGHSQWRSSRCTAGQHTTAPRCTAAAPATPLPEAGRLGSRT
jgi:hypothetical protein